MSDFSLFALFTAGLACMVPFASAYTKPVGAAPVGNPISQPGLNSVVPAGQPFTITWDPTTKGTVTLVLLKGPSSNAVPQYAIVEKTDNDGSYVWTPSTDLQPTDNAQGYGIQLIDDATGQYQYTTQFGISNPAYNKGSSSSSSTSSKGAASYPTSSSSSGPAEKTVTDVYTKYTTYCPQATTLTWANQTKTIATPGMYTLTAVLTTSSVAPKATSSSSSAYYPANNVTMVSPTAYYTPTTVQTSAGKTKPVGPSATYQAPPVQTGAASSFALSVLGLVAAAGVAVLAA